MKTIKILNFFSILLISLTLISCGSFKKVDQRQMPDGAKAKARKNIEEGRGVSIGGVIGGRGSTNYEFSSLTAWKLFRNIGFSYVYCGLFRRNNNHRLVYR